MKNADYSGGYQQVDIGIDKHALEHFKFATISASRHRTSAGDLSLILLHALINTGIDTELPVGHIVQGDMERELLDCAVQLRHVVPELPEGIHEEYRIVPAILARGISRSRGFKLYELTDGWMHSRVGLGARVRDERYSEVGMIVGTNARHLRYVLFHGSILIRGPKETLRLCDFLLQQELIERPDEVVSLGHVVASIGRVECVPVQRNIKVCP